MAEAERHDPPEPSALIERLLRRRTKPLGIIDVRQAQAHYARIAGWIAARFPLLAELAARHDLSEDGEAGAAEFTYAGRAVLHPGEQPVCVPGTPVLALQTLRGGGTPEKSPLTPLCQRSSVTPSSVLPLGKEQDEKTTSRAQGLPQSAPLGESKEEAMPAHTKGREGSARDLIAIAQTSPASPAAKPVKTVWRVRRAATGPERLPPAEPLASTSTQPGTLSRMADGYDFGERLLPLGRGKVGMGVEPSLCTDLGLLPPPSPSPAKGTAIKLRGECASRSSFTK